MIHGFGGGYGFGFMGIFNMIIWLVILIAIIYALIYLIKGFTSHSNIKESSSHEALKILNQRYAKGEITKEEYIDMKRDIED
ncbi:SHOCT domain-containing protein [Deferribacter autotrophicus]|uniref:SHOCT domain-containing protein n=1 Tax=Deferribacter autotrophicus TaxID=500465 RepID=A0A5A8F1Y8_9BACT|nr:SHOCT domain-containing protein [Deferribacter autotrophicus]KAA0256886.1 SHOCT domain-containing protein [Deferribacter autotrophicus]